MMSQVLTAQAVTSVTAPSAREASASKRTGERFAALFERVQTSRRSWRAPAAADRMNVDAPECRADCTGAMCSRSETARPEQPDERLAAGKMSAEESPMTEPEVRPAVSREEEPAQSSEETSPDVVASAPFPELPAGPDVATANPNAGESSGQQPDQQHGQRELVILNPQAGVEGDQVAPEGAQTDSTEASGQKAAPHSAVVSAGLSQSLPGRPVSAPATAQGSENATGTMAPQCAAPWSSQPTAAMPFMGDEAKEGWSGLPGEASEAQGQPAGETQAQGKAPETGESFQVVLAHAGRGRAAATVRHIGLTPAEATADPTKGPIEVNGPNGPEELARVVRAQVGARHSNMMLQLDPPELGRVRVDVKMHQDVLTLRFQAETEAGHDAIAGRIRELTGALEGQGIRLDRVEVEYRPTPDNQREEQSPQQQGGQEWKEPGHTDHREQPEARQNPAFHHASGPDGQSPATGMQDRADSSATAGVDVVV